MSLMKSLFKNLARKEKDDVIKDNLAARLKLITDEILIEYDEGGFLGIDDSSKALLFTLEAIFIHGLKESLKDKFMALSDDPDATSKPDFWPLVLIFSHNYLIKKIEKRSQITTDIGKCRSWLRDCLIECLLPSYVDSIVNQNSALAPYYNKTAFLRDSSCLNSLKRDVANLGKVSFELPTNNCLLNYWQNEVLIMAGFRTAPVKALHVAEGMDVASELGTEPVPMPDALPHYTSILEDVLYDEEEAMKIIMGTPIQDNDLENVSNTEYLSSQGIDTPSKTVPSPSDNRLEMNKDETSAAVQILPGSSPVVSKQEIVSPSPPKETEPPVSYDLLVKDYNPASPPQTSPYYEDLLSRFTVKSEEPSPDDSKKQLNIDDISEFEIVAPVHKNSLDMKEFHIMVSHLSKLMVESGLINQNFTCKTCDQLIGLNLGAAKVCALTGFYYCEACFNGSEVVLPARILFNWDYNKQMVSGKAAAFLEDVKHHPLLDIRLINPRLYLVIYELRELQRLRLKLNLLKMYLFTCRVPVIEALKKQLWPREYLYDHVHLYSLSDLLEIPSGNLENLINDVIKFCENHVYGCSLCSQKGFICEVCQKLEIIYPFQLGYIFRCTKCKNVIHAKCKDTQEECLKCSRIKKRQGNE